MYKVKGRRGLLNWKVCGIQQSEEKDEKGHSKKSLTFIDKYVDIKNSKIKPTLFPPPTEE